MSTIPFVKMHGLGNDFVVVDARRAGIAGELPALARAMCDRRQGVGADGLLVLREGDGAAYARVDVWNADGSAGGMCGNGLRCVARLLQSAGEAGAALVLRMGARIVPVEMSAEIGIGMGRAEFDLAMIPVDVRYAALDAPWLSVEGRRGVAVSMGNPHFVVFVDAVPDGAGLSSLGASLECHDAFPERTNVQFTRVLSSGRLMVWPWERGSGATPACASGACAALAAAAQVGLSGREAEVVMPGGMLRVSWRDDGVVWCAGPAEHVYDGRWPVGASGGRA